MTYMKTKRLISTLIAGSVTLTLFGAERFMQSSVNSAAAQQSSQSILTSNFIGEISGWDVEYWRDGGTGTMYVNNDGTFSAEWDVRPSSNILFRAGRKFGTPSAITQSHEEIGEIVMTFDAEHTTTVNSLLCVYGWTARDTVEWYIFESWGTYAKGRASSQANLIDTYTIPGEGTYEFYVSHERVNVPSIFSNNDTFPQYFSIRAANSAPGADGGRRFSGTVSVSEHFRQWEALGYPMDGALYEVSFCIEAWGSAGSGTVNSLSLDITPPGFGTIVGDINGDGVVDNADLTMLRQILVGIDVPGANLDAADIDGNGSVDNVDLTLLRQHLVGIDTGHGIGLPRK
jgi:hypothetical protein